MKFDENNLNTWSNSTIRTWLNSSESGFINGIDSEFLNIVLTTDVKTQNISSNTIETTKDKFFLASSTELYAQNKSEGEVWDYYRELSKSSNPQNPSENSDSNRIGYDLDGRPIVKWLRTPLPSETTKSYQITTSGMLGSGGVTNARGIFPACQIGIKGLILKNTNA